MSATDIIAIYAAVVSSMVLIWDVYKWKTAGPKILGEISSGMKMFPQPSFWEGNDGLLIIARATNTGDRSTTVTNMHVEYFGDWWSWVRRRPEKAFVVAEPNPAQPIPYVLQPGTVWMGVAPQDKELEAMAKSGRLYCRLHFSHSKRGVTRRILIRAAQTDPQTSR